MKYTDEIFKKISEKWFFTEPLLFSVYCTHRLVPNESMSVPFRTGKGRIEYSPKILSSLKVSEIEEFLKIEVLRILLKHPYQRQPLAANPVFLTLASNVTINDICKISAEAQKFLHGVEFQLPDGLCFEEYYEKLKGFVHFVTLSSVQIDVFLPDSPEQSGMQGETYGSKNADGNGSQNHQSFLENQQASRNKLHSSELSALWEEDEELCEGINRIIDNAEQSNQWGTLPKKVISLIKASRYIEMDYRRMLTHFRTSVLSSSRYRTRMKPSRRYGFFAIGSRYSLTTNLLVAVDVSGSVSDKALSNFFSVINRFFKYGIEKIDVIQFDSELKSKEPIPMKKARSTVKIIGRGGTSFQPAADFYCSHTEYDGLIYFTDGIAPVPTFNTKRLIDVLWVLCGKFEYEKSKDWINKIKRNRATFIPAPV